MCGVFDFLDYKEFLVEVANERGQRSGFKTALATVCGCNGAYISSIFSGNAHLSLEQAERACSFLAFTTDEAHYFLILVQMARSGTVSLRTYFRSQADALRQNHLNVEMRLKMSKTLKRRDEGQYYSSWVYAAIHVALSIPQLAKSADALASYFNLSLWQVKNALKFLVQAEMAVENQGVYKIGPKQIHLGKKSAHLQQHHSNWRLKAIQSLETTQDTGLHYSSVVTLSRDDSFKIKELLLEAVKRSVDEIVASPEEEVFALTLDFFPMN